MSNESLFELADSQFLISSTVATRKATSIAKVSTNESHGLTVRLNLDKFGELLRGSERFSVSITSDRSILIMESCVSGFKPQFTKRSATIHTQKKEMIELIGGDKFIGTSYEIKEDGSSIAIALLKELDK